MENMPSDYSPYDIPELEESEFALAVSPCPPIEECSDIGDTGDPGAISSVIADALFREFD